ncbi:elongation factor 1 beta', partial [Elysia marginata]
MYETYRFWLYWSRSFGKHEESGTHSHHVEFDWFRYVPSQADNVVYDAVGKAPAASLAHALRWYNQMKSWQKPAVIAKSNIVLDVKPWEDTTDMKEMERLVRTIEADGLLWGA